jgi:hypothetical protein
MSYAIDSSDKTDYRFDWINDLGEGETIASYVLTPSDGIEYYNDSKVDDDTAVLYWVRNASGIEQQITCHVVTSQQREMDKTAYFIVTEK